MFALLQLALRAFIVYFHTSPSRDPGNLLLLTQVLQMSIWYKYSDTGITVSNCLRIPPPQINHEQMTIYDRYIDVYVICTSCYIENNTLMKYFNQFLCQSSNIIPLQETSTNGLTEP